MTQNEVIKRMRKWWERVVLEYQLQKQGWKPCRRFDQMLCPSSGRRWSPEEGQSMWSKRRQGFQPYFWSWYSRTTLSHAWASWEALTSFEKVMVVCGCRSQWQSTGSLSQRHWVQLSAAPLSFFLLTISRSADSGSQDCMWLCVCKWPAAYLCMDIIEYDALCFCTGLPDGVWSDADVSCWCLSEVLFIGWYLLLWWWALFSLINQSAAVYSLYTRLLCMCVVARYGFKYMILCTGSCYWFLPFVFIFPNAHLHTSTHNSQRYLVLSINSY